LSEFLLNRTFYDKNELFQKNPVIEKDHEQIRIVQFHPGYTYEDFVKGIVTEIDNEGKVGYKVRDKVLMKIVRKASENPDKKYVLIIDEMNRANLPSVLGELIYAIEYRGESVEGIYEDEASGNTDITIPDNLYLIGTMNTADRSIGHIDYAIRRRFVFIDVPSESKFISDEKAKKLYSEIESFFTMNHLASDFKKDDVMLGHSYFLTSKRAIKQRLEFEIIPLLKEYVKDGILIGEDILKRIVELSKYV
jgi:5-methylcytosine-specific restriction protein B